MSTKIKRLMLVIALAMLMAIVLSVNVFAARDEVGDLNRDGVKDEQDAIYLLNHYLFGESNGIFDLDQPSDYNSDGVVDENDAIFLLNNIIFGDVLDVFHICDHPDTWEIKEIVQPTCKVGGYTVVKCKCGKEAEILPTDKTDDHSFDWEKADLTHQATCLENGYITATCTVCGATDEQKQAATGNHDWKGGNCEEGAICSTCNTQQQASGHKYPDAPTFTQPATCKGGYEEYKCQNPGCNSTYINELKPTDHNYAEGWQLAGERATDAKCIYVYVETATCKDCGETHERITGEVTKHTETTKTTLPTCVKVGEKIRSCSVCGEVLETVEMPANEWAHSFDDGVTVGSVTTFTCQNEGCGKTKTTVKATEDGKVDLKEAEEVELEGGAAIIPDENIKNELGDKDISVSIGEVKADELENLSDEDKELLKELGDAPIFDLNLTADGEKVTSFGENNKMTVRLPYTLEEGDDPDCIIIWYIGDDGHIDHFEAKYVDGYAVFETNHFSYYTVTRMTPAQRCEYYGTHNNQTTVVPATCVTGGYTMDICTRCGNKTISNETEALGHNWSTKVTDATCTTAGQTLYRCKACDITYVEVIKAIGHNVVEITDGYVAPTCTAKGEKLYGCSNAGCKFSYKEEIAQIDHSYSATVIAPDCENAGYTVNQCKNCSASYTSEPTKATGHSYTEGKCGACGVECKHEYEYGLCKICNMEKQKPDPNSCTHKFYEKSRIDATCTTAGFLVNKCSNCEIEVSAELAPLGHEHIVVERLEPTCTTAGKLIYKCKRCDDGYDVAIAIIEHSFNKEGKCEICGVECEHKYSYGICDICGCKDPNFVETDCRHEKITYTYEFINEDARVCYLGVRITETCEKCGLSESFIAYDCFTWIVEVDLSGYDHCGNHDFSYYRCACGAETDWVGNVNLNVSLEGMPDGIYGFGCKDCDMTALVTQSYEENGCVEIMGATYNFYYKSEHIHELSVSMMEYGHEPDSSELEIRFINDKNCENGYVMTGTCMECGEKIELTIYTHVEISYESTGFTEYGACNRHAFRCYSCACGENTYTYIGGMESIPSAEPGKTAYYCYDCGLTAEEIYTYGDIDDECKATGTKTYVFTIGAKVVFTYEEPFEAIKHSYSETISFNNGKDCTDGITIERTCVNCGDRETEIYEGHMSEEIRMDLSEYNVCDSHVIWVYQCTLCGCVESMWHEGLSGYGTENGRFWFCSEEKCDLNIVEIESIGEKNENCWAPVIFHTTLMIGDKEILSVDNRGGTIRHNNTESYEMLGATCDDGIRVTFTCKDCGQTSSSYVTYGHSYERINIDLTEYGGCKTHRISGMSCVTCGAVEKLNISGVIRTDTDNGWIGTCKSCAVVVSCTETIAEVVSSCVIKLKTEYVISFNGEEIRRISGYSNSVTHDYEYTTEFLGETCEEGIRTRGTCKICGETTEITAWGHQYSEKYIDLSEYGACAEHMLRVHQCSYCNDYNYVDLEGGKLNGQVQENFRVTYCKTCNIELSQTMRYGTPDENCWVDIHNIYTLVINKEEILSATGTSSTMQHDFEEQIEFLGKTCEDGVIVRRTCRNCKATEEGTRYGHDYEYIEIDLSEYGACVGHILTTNQCTVCKMYSNLRLEGDVKIYTQTTENGRRNFCKSCAIELILSQTYGDKDENCLITIYNNYDLIFDGKILLSATGLSYRAEHSYEYSYIFDNVELGCEGGVTIRRTCSACGDWDEWHTYDHDQSIEERYDLADYGHKCETGYISLMSCACGQYKNFNLNIPNFNHQKGYDTEIDGVWHNGYSYVCSKCEYEIVLDNYEIKDANCNAIGYQTVTFGGHTVYNIHDNGKSHNSAEKEIPEETYAVDNGDGTITRYYAFEIYCPDCLASVEKRLVEETLDADGNCLSIKYTCCNYQMGGENGETIAVIYRTEFYEYLIVETFSGKQSLIRAEVYTNYNEDGSTFFERHDYEYDKDSICSYTVTHTNSNGDTNTERVEGKHPSTISKYVLNANSKTCLDGLDRVRYCTICGVETGRNENVRTDSHYLNTSDLYVAEMIDLSQYGAVCEAYAKIYACPCGEKKEIQIDTKCDYSGFGTGRTDENGIYHHYLVYACSVTDPVACGFKWVREEASYFDENCNEILSYTFYFGVNETNDGYQGTYKISYPTGYKKHAESKTTETVTETRYESIVACVKCGMIESTVVVENGVRTETEFQYNSNGNLSNKYIRQYLAVEDNRHDYPLFNRNENYDENGNITWWNQNEYTYPNAANGDYCYRIRTQTNMDSETANVYEEDTHSWNWNRNYCTPTIVRQHCSKCGITKDDYVYYAGHNFEYNSDKDLFVCWKCGLESVSSGNGEVGFEDKTLQVGGGTKYVIGWYNNYNGEYYWNLDLIDAQGNMYELDMNTIEMIDEYHIGLDAMAIREFAKAKGLGDCEYMIRLAFVPADGKGELDYAITLDPHMYKETDHTVPDGGCENKGEYTWTYTCAFCGYYYTESEMGHYFTSGTQNSVVLVAADGTITLTRSYIYVCKYCGETRCETNVSVYAPNGKRVKYSYDNGNYSYEDIYSYDYANGIYTRTRIEGDNTITEKYEINGERILYSKNEWTNGYEEIVYDYENDLYTVTRVNPYNYTVKSIYVRRISNDTVVSEEEIYNDGGNYRITYVEINGMQFTSYLYRKYSDGRFSESNGAVDNENGVWVVTTVNENSVTTIDKYSLVSGELVFE